MTNEQLIQELIEAAYETGYYSGKLEDGQEHHLAAIERREKLRRQVLLRLTPAGADLKPTSASMASEAGDNARGAE